LRATNISSQDYISFASRLSLFAIFVNVCLLYNSTGVHQAVRGEARQCGRPQHLHLLSVQCGRRQSAAVQEGGHQEQCVLARDQVLIYGLRNEDVIFL